MTELKNQCAKQNLQSEEAVTKAKVDLQVERNRVKDLQTAYENLTAASKKQQVINEQQVQALKMMQREFRSVEKLLEEKDTKIGQLAEQLLEL